METKQMARVSRQYHKPVIERKMKVALYARLSVGSKNYCSADGNTSIENQIDLMMNYLNGKEEFQFVKTYTDTNYSGKDFNRPAFQEMIQDIRSGKINCVIVKDLSRFGRNYVEVGDYVECVFPFLDVRFIAVNDKLDTANQQMNLTTQVRAIIDEEQRRYISKATKGGLKARAMRGKMTLVNAPYGYNRTSDGMFTVDEIAAEVAIEIFHMATNGISNAKIAKKLNDENIPTRSGGTTKWAQSTIGQILKNRFYLGEQLYRIDGETFIKKNLHASILDDELFNKAQHKGNTRGVAVLHPPAPLVGKVVCDECGRSMPRSTHMSHGREVATYQCRTGTIMSGTTCYHGTMPEEKIVERIFVKLDKYIHQLVVKRTELKDKLIDQNSKLERRLDEIQVLISDLRQESLIDNYELLRAGNLSKERFEASYDAAQGKIAKLKDETITLRERYQMLYDEHARICDTVKVNLQSLICPCRRSGVYTKSSL